jgi:threonine/homoserine/homoserine lactone efflux protein
LRYTLTSGPKVGLAAVAGVQIGLAFHTLLAVLGVSLVIASSPPLFKTVAMAGALYLGWLGVQGLRGGSILSLQNGGPVVGAGKACRDAILCNILNPKVILLFLALFPNFVDPGRTDVSLQLITLSAVLIAINVLWQAPMVRAAEAVRHWLVAPAIGLHAPDALRTPALEGKLVIAASPKLRDHLRPVGRHHVRSDHAERCALLPHRRRQSLQVRGGGNDPLRSL